MATMTLISDLLTLNMQNSVLKAQFIISAANGVEIIVLSYSSDGKTHPPKASPHKP